MAWAIIKCNIFLAGLSHFTVVTDHRPLVPILNSHRLDEIHNPRLQRLKTKIMGYSFTATWLKRKSNDAPDALSRYPTANPQPGEALAESEVDHQAAATAAEIRAVTVAGKEEPVRLAELRKAADEDVEYQKLKAYITSGFPKQRHQLVPECRRYWNVHAQLSVEDGLILYGCRLLIPTQMRRKVLVQLHEAHQGMVRTKERARLTVYWPGIDGDIDQTISSCKLCQDSLPSQQKEPISLKSTPQRPFQEIAANFCSYAGQQYLITVDCYSDWPDITPMMTSTTTARLLSSLRSSFCRTGAPDKLWTDQGPQFTSQAFQSFAKQWGFQHVTSTPRYPQSNGKAEATVKSMKKLIQSAWQGRSLNETTLAKALIQYRNTPSRKDRLSPAQKLYGRPIQDTLPAHRRSFAPEWQRSATEAESQAQATSDSIETTYNSKARALPEIHAGSRVAVQNHETKRWDTYGTVAEIGPHRRYFIKTQSGRILVRNRRFLRRRIPPSFPTPNVGVSPGLAPMQPRRSDRTRSRPNGLIEEIGTLNLQVDCDDEAPEGGEV